MGDERKTLSNEESKKYSFFIKDYHGAPYSYTILSKLLDNHSNIQVVYLECPPNSKESKVINKFMSGETNFDDLFEGYVSLFTLVRANKDEFKKAFKNTFEQIKTKVGNKQLNVECIDDWSEAGIYTYRYRINTIMANRIATDKDSIFLCGGLHFETIFALQDHINPNLLDICLLYESDLCLFE